MYDKFLQLLESTKEWVSENSGEKISNLTTITYVCRHVKKA